MTSNTDLKVTITKKYNGPEDIYDELVGDEETNWLLGLVAFAVVEEQKIEWIKHHSSLSGNTPTSEQVKNWYEELPSGAVLRAKGTAENALSVYSTEVVEEVLEDTRKEIEESVLSNEIRELKRFWPQFGVNLAGGFISSILFALLLVAIALILFKSPSLIDIAKEISSPSEVLAHGQK